MWQLFKTRSTRRSDYKPCSQSWGSTGPEGDNDQAACGSCIDNNQQVTALKDQVKLLKIYSAITSLALVLIAASLALIQAHGFVHSDVHTPGERHHLGSDPNGFVPPNVGEPPRWTYFSAESPYHVPEDTFYDLNKTRAVVEKIKRVHNSSNVLVNGHSADWVHPDGTVTKLPYYFSTGTVRPMYIIRGFHQMHCLISIIEEYGHRVHNRTSVWSPKHIAHCVNTVAEAVMCLADATPMSYVNGFGVGHVTDDQQFMCRDYGALKRWANDPKRGVRVRVVKNKTVKGSGDSMEEIMPFPELTEMQKQGLE